MQLYNKTGIKSGVVLAFALVVSGCANFAPYFKLQPPPVSSTINDTTAEASEIKLVAWQRFFQDENIKELITLALEQNRDLHIAAANVAEAEGYFQIEKQTLIPNISLDGANSVNKNSATVFGNDNVTHGYNASIGLASYEIDFWGRVKNLNEAALASYFATIEAQRASKLTVISSTATAYINWLAALQSLSLSEETLKSRIKAYNLIELREATGIASTLDLAQAEVAMLTVEAQKALSQRNLSSAKAVLELLVGAPIGAILARQSHSNNLVFDFSVPDNLHSYVLMSRPDIMAAEEILRASNANIGAARAAFFPQFRLLGSGGFASADLSDLFKSSSQTWSFVPSISIPLFGNANDANLAVAKARNEKAIAEYEKLIQGAFSEVYIQLEGQKTRKVEITANLRLVSAQKKRLYLSDERYLAGLSSYFEVLDSKQNLFVSQQSLLEAERGAAESIVNLYRALGGGDQVTDSYRSRSQIKVAKETDNSAATDDQTGQEPTN
ncbi:MAG: TolC family protein [Oceanospirillaceae bacterium]|nr:TolC family protein [Oceanospirillaceae bacterium]